MPRIVHQHDDPDRVVVGTVGEPGQRTFYLQARSGSRLTSVALEKQQAAVLAERLDDLLDQLLTSEEPGVPAVAPTALEDLQPLDSPIDEEFRVASLALGWDDDGHRVVIEASAPGDDDEEPEDEEDGPDLLRVRVTPAVARAFVKRTMAVVGAGRPPCPFCTLPLDPQGHVCPRANGYRR